MQRDPDHFLVANNVLLVSHHRYVLGSEYVTCERTLGRGQIPLFFDVVYCPLAVAAVVMTCEIQVTRMKPKCLNPMCFNPTRTGAVFLSRHNSHAIPI